ncbi:dTDP-4-dehydrorhamnose 3,5-epimerase family protein [Streptomyces violaceusniger]|uniref:dTDP-4-dehydrorhamnose 3,5-epimerase family protein n=1 Tax=Streptomyces violaceusniger TaxID=68280 RepID=UPI0031DD9C19
MRVGSPALGRWDSVRLDPNTCRAVHLEEGLGHAYTALHDGTVAVYVSSVPHRTDPGRGARRGTAAVVPVQPATPPGPGPEYPGRP